jgi:hypothetical protein
VNENVRPKLSVFIATSIDSFIAKNDGDISWLTNLKPPSHEDEHKDYGYALFFSVAMSLA